MDDPSGKWLKTLVTLLKQPQIGPAALETAMRFCVCYTQVHSTACRIANMGGIVGLLNLPSSSSFVGVEEMADSPMQPSDGTNLATGKLWFVDRTSSQASPSSRIHLHPEAGKVVCGNALGLLKISGHPSNSLIFLWPFSSADFFNVLAELEGAKVEAPISSSEANSKE